MNGSSLMAPKPHSPSSNKNGSYHRSPSYSDSAPTSS